MSQCFLLPKRPANGNPIVVRRTGALGDALCATVVADKLAYLGHQVTFQAHEHAHCILRRVGSVATVERPNGFAHVNLDGAYERDPARRQKHFHTMFFEAANAQLRRFGVDLGPPTNCRPTIRRFAEQEAAIAVKLAKYPKPWVMVCPRSDSFSTRQVPDGIWQEAASKIDGTAFWLGTHPAPKPIVDLECRHFDNVIDWLSVADLLVSVDTGPLHVAAALAVPIVAIGQSSLPDYHLGDQNDFSTIYPPLPCLGCMENICPKNQWTPPCQTIDPSQIAAEANLRSRSNGMLSAVVCIYKPDEPTVNRCLKQLVDQVDEIVVASDRASVIPPNILKHPKIRYVQSRKHNSGYSGKANFGARHTRGELILFLNDDCFLNPDAVQKMREVMKPDTGMVSNLLRYPDMTIYHAGKIRHKGERGWGHIDYKKQHPTFGNVVELENCCGCCVLVRRNVFYEAGGYDEDLPLFAQDDAFALMVRKMGYKILFTPFSEGIHMEHQSIKKTGDIHTLVGQANAIFARKYGAYLEHNLNRVPFGDFFYT